MGLNCGAALPSPNTAATLWDWIPSPQVLPTTPLPPTHPQVPAPGGDNQLPPPCMAGEEVSRSGNEELTPTINRSHKQASTRLLISGAGDPGGCCRHDRSGW